MRGNCFSFQYSIARFRLLSTSTEDGDLCSLGRVWRLIHGLPSVKLTHQTIIPRFKRIRYLNVLSLCDYNRNRSQICSFVNAPYRCHLMRNYDIPLCNPRVTPPPEVELFRGPEPFLHVLAQELGPLLVQFTPNLSPGRAPLAISHYQFSH